MASRQLRSASRKPEETVVRQVADLPSISSISWTKGIESLLHCGIQTPGHNLAGLSKQDLALLRKKQKKLKAELSDIEAILLGFSSHMRISCASTLLFAQYSAGTAVCISQGGLILTCAHCIAENDNEYTEFDSAWLLTCDGIPVLVKCLAWDNIKDLALLQAVTVEAVVPQPDTNIPRFSFVPIGSTSRKEQIYCIGQPGRDDLEAKTSRKTTYRLVEISEGHIRGQVAGADPQDNSEIGTLKHDAWTYWGHSGAPLLNSHNGKLLGLHSSWDDQTAMRHGVPAVAIRSFLRSFANSKVHPACNKIHHLLEADSGTAASAS